MSTIPFIKNSYKAKCEELVELIRFRKELDKREKELKKDILRDCDGKPRMEYGIKVDLRIRKGSIDIELVQKAYDITDNEIEGFRKEDSEYWDIRTY